MSLPSLKEMTKSKEVKIGHYVGEFVTPGIGHILAAAKCDYVFFDLEHSGFGIETLKNAIRFFECSGIRVIVRSPSKNYEFISRICDAGAEGIMVPMIKDREEASNIISNIKYPPIGSRGVALGIAHDNYYRGGIPVSTQLELSNQKTTFFALIETKEGADNANEIASLTDVDCLWVGHFDLSASLGIPGQFDHHLYKESLNKIIQAAKNNKKSLGRLVTSPKEGSIDLDLGFDFCCFGTDTAIYQKALITGVNEIRKFANGK